MGAWDFVINLSGSDLPLRDVDDTAAMLASARGNGHEYFTNLFRQGGFRLTLRIFVRKKRETFTEY